jgi:spore maturation protein CgeD
MKLSILCTTYNRPAMLARCLAGLDRQTSPAWEVILLDDNSNDGQTERLALDFLSSHPGRYFKSDVQVADRLNRVRYSVMINLGQALATGDYLLALPDDNELLPHAVATILAHFTVHPDHLAGYFGQRIQDADFRTGERLGIRDEIRHNASFGQPLNQAFCQVDHGQVVYRRDLGVTWSEDPAHWACADGITFDALIRAHGPLYPIGDVLKDPLSIYYVTESSVCRQPVEQALAKLGAI